MNSRNKGKRGERAWRDELRANGYEARRGQQFSGSPESPDVVCDELSWIHFEVKCVERLNIEDAMAQARRDCKAPHPGPLPSAEREKIPILAHKRNFCGWLVTMDAETFFRLLRGEFPEQPSVDSLAPASSALSGPSPSANSSRRFPSSSSLRGDFQPRMDTDGHELNGAHGVTRPATKDLGVSREAHDTTRETRVLPRNTEETKT